MTDDPRVLAARLLSESRYAMPIAEAMALVLARRKELLTPSASEPDLTAPEPILPIIDAPELFAAEFWDKRTATPSRPAPKPRQKTARTRKAPPVPSDKTSPFRVIQGGKTDGDSDPPTR